MLTSAMMWAVEPAVDSFPKVARLRYVDVEKLPCRRHRGLSSSVIFSPVMIWVVALLCSPKVVCESMLMSFTLFLAGGIVVAEVRMDDATLSCDDSCLFASDGECDELRVRASPSEKDCLSSCGVNELSSSACCSISSS